LEKNPAKPEAPVTGHIRIRAKLRHGAVPRGQNQPEPEDKTVSAEAASGPGLTGVARSQRPGIL